MLFRRNRTSAEYERWYRANASWISQLASYNSERARGLVHTLEWSEYMARLQTAFDTGPKPWVTEH
jgi:hypothetical protein